MIKRLLFSSLLTILLFACNSGEESSPATDVEVARAFIRDILDAKFKEAEQFLLKDEVNQQYFERFKEAYNAKDKAELEKFKASDILIHEISNVSDSITIVNYSNSYKKEAKNKVKLVRINEKWLIDLKYTFSGNL